MSLYFVYEGILVDSFEKAFAECPLYRYGGIHDDTN